MITSALLVAVHAANLNRPRPTLDDFMGINVHTVQFKPDLYRPVARHVRNYHPVEWDLGQDVNHPTEFPFARNRVNWDDLYGVWKREGYATIASLMFETIPATAWRAHPGSPRRYAEAWGRYQASVRNLDAVEIGNEPGEIPDTDYTTIFREMASGLRATAPDLTVATCAVRVGPSGRYHKSVDTIRDSLPLVDVLTIHTYSELAPWPTFERAHPEHPSAPFLQPVKELIAWRDQHTPGKPIWVTEFGWDASTKRPDPTGDWARWIGNSEQEQAQWIVRTWLELARLPVDRAYQFWFNDTDQPMMHGASGLTRNYQPKPAFHAAAHLRELLGPYRFAADIVRDTDRVFAAEWHHATDPKEAAWVVWVPTREGKSARVRLPNWRGKQAKAVAIRMTEGIAIPVTFRAAGGALEVPASGTPVVIRFRR